MTTLKIRTVVAFLPLLIACADVPAVAEGEGETAEAQQAFSIDYTMINQTVTGNWPKTVTFCLSGTHAAHVTPTKPLMWRVSWSSTPVPTYGPCISRTVNQETCGLTAMVEGDSEAHTGNLAEPKVHHEFDYRTPVITASATSLPVGQAVTLTALAPHGTRHCDQLGSFVWATKTSDGQWPSHLKFGQNLTPVSRNNSTPGFETYRLESTHKGIFSASNEITVTWSSPPATCTIGGATYANGTINPNNSCQKCNTSQSTTAWSTNNGHVAQEGRCKLSTGTCLAGYICAGEGCSSDDDCDAICWGSGTMCSGIW